MDRLIARIIQDFSLDLFEPIFSRDLDLGKPLPPRAGNLVSVVVGMRRSGKTYRLFQEMRRLERDGVPSGRMLYFNFEDDRLRPLTKSTGDAVLDAFYEMHPQAYDEGVYLFFDEVQELKDWGRWLRRIVDTRKATIYVTGSSSKLLSAEVASEFRGRSIQYELLPYSFGEFAAYHEPEVFGARPFDVRSFGSKELALGRRFFEAYLQRGGFPGVQGEDDARAVMVLQGYAQHAVARDVIERHNISNPQMVTLLAHAALSLSGRELSLRKMEGRMRSSGVVTNRAALSEAMGYLEDSFLLARLQRFSRSLGGNPRSAAKVYAIDPGLACANSPAPCEDKGQRLEDAVYLELRRRHPLCRPGTLGSLKTARSGFEVDFVVGDALLQEASKLYQVAADVGSAKTYERETRALREAMSERGLRSAHLLTGENYERENKVPEGVIHETPAWIWCLGQD